MPESISLRVITPAETIVEVSDAAWVQVQLVDGCLGIWPGHTPLLAETVSATLRYADIARLKEEALDLKSGILQIDREGITILTSGLIKGDTVREPPPDHKDERRYKRLTQTLLTPD